MNKSTARRTQRAFITPRGLAGAESPYAWYETMRNSGGIHYDEEREAWDVFSYELVHQVLSDYKHFSSRTSTEGPVSSLIGMDPPRHKLYRSLVNQAFTQKSIDMQADRIGAIAGELLDKVAGTGHMDIIQDFSYPLPVIVIAEMLGVRPEDRELFKDWSDRLVASVDPTSGQTVQQLTEVKQQAAEELYRYFTEVIEWRRKAPGDDLVSELLRAKIDNEHLDMPSLLSFCLLLLVAGNETTTNLIGNALLTFLENQDALERLYAEPDLLPSALEESLRYRSPIQSLSRRAVEDITLNGKLIQADQEVVVWMGSANRDEAKFAGASQFIPDRKPNPHLAFGQGIHFCLGAPLARLEARIAVKALLQRCRHLHLDAGAELTRTPGSFVFGYKELPVTFDPVRV
ncbi:cytochrome P450 [Paenibacillus filicis]|uniref:Cytochrome P450 n=1 Tax=Paenibacillus filicis TaxID=669464 RepID=A0ABU9DWM9_9BACL